MVNIRQTNISQAFLAESLSDKKDISEGIDINKTNASKECDICHYWYFLSKDFNHQLYTFAMVVMINLKKAVNFNELQLFLGSDYRIYCWYISKDDPINTMKNSNLDEKRGLL